MADKLSFKINGLQMELAELRRIRSWSETNSNWSSAARQTAVAKIDADIAAKMQELDSLKRAS